MPRAEERGATKEQALTCQCKSCKKFRKEPNHGVYQGEIHSYSSSPDDGWQPQYTLAELNSRQNGGPQPYYMGVELETMAPPQDEALSRKLRRELNDRFPYPAEPFYSSYRSEEYRQWERAIHVVQRQRDDYVEEFWREHTYISADELVSMAAPADFWHPKHDGSVTGPEFASLPATLDYWYGIKPYLKDMFTSLLHAGARSFSGDQAGMHISISIIAFADAAHLARFARLVNRNVSWSTRMSQRTQSSLSDWCHLAEDVFADRRQTVSSYGYRSRTLDQWAEEVMRDGYSSGGRYNAINATCGGGRIEFRLPRGTLRLDRFYKNLEWVHAMVEYTRKFGDTSSASFMRWVMARDEYPDLRAFITEKFHIERQEAFEPSPAPPVDAELAPRVDFAGRPARISVGAVPSVASVSYPSLYEAISNAQGVLQLSSAGMFPDPDPEPIDIEDLSLIEAVPASPCDCESCSVWRST